MATSKVNIFQTLAQHASDSEEEDFQKSKSKKTGEKKDAPRGGDKGTKDVKKTGASGAPQKQEKEDHTRPKDPRKAKGVTDKPHPQERHSGTGHSAYGGKPKKGGAGKGNTGKPGDEKNVAEEGAEEEETTEQEEEKPEGLTLQEYYATQKQASNEPKVNEAKAKLTHDVLIKELGNSTLLKGKNTQNVDDHKVGKKKERLDVDHHAQITSDHSDLLGFRTGFIEKEFKPREPREEGGVVPTKKPFTKKAERENAKEEESPSAQPTAEGEQKEGETTEKAEGQGEKGERRKDYKPRGDNRGGRGGYRGDRPQGERGGYQGKGPQQAKINFSDESLFPKLG